MDVDSTSSLMRHGLLAIKGAMKERVKARLWFLATVSMVSA